MGALRDPQKLTQGAPPGAWPGARFSKAPETFRACKAIAKSRTLRLQSCFIHIFLIWREVPYIQEVSGVYTSPFLGTIELKMALRARKVSGSFEKRAPGRLDSKDSLKGEQD